MRVQITSCHRYQQFIISSDSESMACMTELAAGVVNSRETKPQGLPQKYHFSCLPVGRKGLGEALGNSNKGIRGNSEWRRYWHINPIRYEFEPSTLY